MYNTLKKRKQVSKWYKQLEKISIYSMGMYIVSVYHNLK